MATCTREKKIKSYIIYFLLSIYPIISGYSFVGNISLGTVILSGIALIVVLFKTRTIYVDINFMMLIIYIFVLNLFIVLLNPSYLEASIVLKNVFLISIMAVILTLIGNSIDIDRMYPVYRIIAYISIGFIILQYLSVNFFNVLMPNGRIPFLTSFSYAYISFRPSSFFLEPSYFAMYLLPLIGLAFQKKDWAIIIFSFIGIFISTSRLGIIIFFIILIYNIYKSPNLHLKLSHILIRFFIVLIVFVIVKELLSNTSTFKYITDSITKIDISSNIRLSQGFLVFFEYPTIQKIFGVGIGNVGNYINNAGILSGINLDFYNWANTLATMFLTSGVIGGFLFIIYIVKLFKNVEESYLTLPLILLLFSITDSIFINQNFAYIMMIINSVIKMQSSNIKKILM